MKKILIALIVLGLIAIGVSNSNASSTRTTPHKFRTFTENTDGGQGVTIYRITGVTTSTLAVFGIYNATATTGATLTTCAVEGGEATSGDALPHYYFGPEGLSLDTGFTVLVNNCYVTVEYL